MSLQPASVARDQLRAIVERVERLEEEQAALAVDKRGVYAEAKSNGFDTKALRKIIALRKKDANAAREEAAILSTYMHALGMQPDLFAQSEDQDADFDEVEETETEGEKIPYTPVPLTPPV